MPRFFLFLGFWIGRFSNEENRAHVHAVKFRSDAEMKVWLEPEVEIEYSKNIPASTAHKILNEIRNRRDECLRKWRECEGKSR